MRSSALDFNSFSLSTFFNGCGILYLCATGIAQTTPQLTTLSEEDVGNNTLSEIQEISVLPYNGFESMVCSNGVLYASSGQGKILKVKDSEIEELTRIGEFDNETRTSPGRPLGVRYSLNGRRLIVADSNLGLYSISLKSGKKKKLFPKNNDFNVTFFNDLDILPNGTILVSESSSEFPVTEYLNSILSKTSSGRVLSVDPKTGEWRELVTGLDFANGVQLHRDGKTFLVAEAATGNIYRVPLDGSPMTIFAEALPGTPDNIRMSPRGGYWVPLSNVGRKSIKATRDRLPFERILSTKLSSLPLFQRLQQTESAALLRLDEDGKVIEELRDPAKRVPNVAEVCEDNGVLYTTSYFLPYIGRLQL